MAANPVTPAEILMRLSTDDDHSVKWNVATNPGSTAEILASVAFPDNDKCDEVLLSLRAQVAQHGNATESILSALVEDLNEDVCTAAAFNSSCPVDVLLSLADFDSGGVVLRLDEDDRSFAYSTGSEVRAAVDSNPNTPPEALAKLATDGDVQVRYAVYANPGADEHTVATALEVGIDLW